MLVDEHIMLHADDIRPHCGRNSEECKQTVDDISTPCSTHGHASRFFRKQRKSVAILYYWQQRRFSEKQRALFALPNII